MRVDQQVFIHESRVVSVAFHSSPCFIRRTVFADHHHPNSDKLDIFYLREPPVGMQADIFSRPDGICHQAVRLVAIAILELTNRELTTRALHLCHLSMPLIWLWGQSQCKHLPRSLKTNNRAGGLE
jgi:hypothetical protein